MLYIVRLTKILLVLLLTLPVYLRAEEGSFNFLDPQTWVDDTFRDKPESRPRHVAILPFANEADAPEGTETVRRAFYNHFSSLAYGDLELVQVDQRLRQAYLYEEKALAKAPLDKLAALLKTDAIIRGKVTSYSKTFALLASSVTVGAELEMVSIPDGKVLWRGKQTAVSINGGLPTNPLDVVMTLVSVTANMRETVLYRVTDQLCREMIATIPDAPLQTAAIGPVIRSVVHNGAIPHKAGDWLEVAMEGNPDHYAAFDIGSFKKGLPMEEIKPGIYKGRYQVATSDNVKKETLVVHLGNAVGQTSQWTDFQATLLFDSLPPKVPTSLAGRGSDGKASIKWTPSLDEDLAAYVVMRSESPLSGYREIARVETPAFQDGGLRNHTTYYYKVAAVDRIGNTSSPSQSLSVTPVRAGPTAISEDLQQDETWRKEASPYVISKSIIIPRGVRLDVDPGVEIVFEGDVGMTVKGHLVMEGKGEEPILLRGADNNKGWQGILLDQSIKENRLKQVSIKDAKLGVVVYESKVILDNVKLSGNHTALNLISASDAVVRNSLVSNNREVGILISQAKPTLQGNTIEDNGQFGLVVRNASPTVRGNHFHGNRQFDVVVANKKVALDLSGNEWGTCNPFLVMDRIVGLATNTTCLPVQGGKVVALAASLPKASETKEGTASVKLATEKFQQGDFLGTYLELTKIAEEDRSAPAHYLLGRLLSTSGKMKESLDAFQKASEQDLDQPGYTYWLGIQYLRMGNLDKARQTWHGLLDRMEHESTLSILKVISDG